MRTASRECRSAGVVVLEGGQEGNLIPNVEQTRVKDVVETLDEGVGSAEKGYESCLVVRDEAAPRVSCAHNSIEAIQTIDTPRCLTQKFLVDWLSANRTHQAGCKGLDPDIPMFDSSIWVERSQ